jgi:NAD(P)-dependent dehydrogenase (short-subunit alcohol dehydrogenase family)
MMAKALADAGAARVYIVGRRTDVLQSAAAGINKPTVVVPLYCDVTSKISLESVVSVIENDAGFLNLVVCNAGVGGPQVPFPAPGSSIEEWQAKNLACDFEAYTNTFKLNVTSVWFTAMSCLKLLDAGNKRGNLGWSSQVVVTSSVAAFNKKAPGGWAYGQSKAAATHLAKQLSVVLPTWGIRWVCLLSPFLSGSRVLIRGTGRTVSVQDVGFPPFLIWRGGGCEANSHSVPQRDVGAHRASGWGRYQ